MLHKFGDGLIEAPEVTMLRATTKVANELLITIINRSKLANRYKRFNLSDLEGLDTLLDDNVIVRALERL